MDIPPLFVIALRFVWLPVVAYWIWSARQVKAPVRTESRARRFLLYILPIIIAVLLLGPGPWYGHSILRAQFISHAVAVESLGLTLCLAGTVLACYARQVLGRNWSGVVQLKQDHELIQRGPYRWIRHPIYTGFLLLLLGTALMVGEWRGLLSLAIVFASFWRKLRLEETWLTQHFGDRYAEYRRHTKALVPGVF